MDKISVTRNFVEKFSKKFPHLQEHIASLFLQLSNQRTSQNFIPECMRKMEYFFKVGKLTIVDDENTGKEEQFSDMEMEATEAAMFMQELSKSEMDDLYKLLRTTREAGANPTKKDENQYDLMSGGHPGKRTAYNTLRSFCHPV
jgi:hypothetical protein